MKQLIAAALILFGGCAVVSAGSCPEDLYKHWQSRPGTLRCAEMGEDRMYYWAPYDQMYDTKIFGGGFTVHIMREFDDDGWRHKKPHGLVRIIILQSGCEEYYEIVRRETDQKVRRPAGWDNDPDNSCHPTKLDDVDNRRRCAALARIHSILSGEWKSADDIYDELKRMTAEDIVRIYRIKSEHFCR